jgi:hypothetical protein
MAKATYPAADRLFRIIAQLDSHFATDDHSPADVDRWRELKRQIARMRGGLVLIDITLREERELGNPFTADTARKLEQHTRFGLGESEE